MENETVKTSINQPEKKNRGLSILMVLVVLAVLGGITYAIFTNKKSDNLAGNYETVNRVSAEEVELFLQDLNPMMLKQLSDNPEAKKQLAENLEQLFTIANQAKKEGLTAQDNVRRELNNIRVETISVTYDRAVNKDKGPSPPFGFVTEEQVNQFWSGGGEESGFWKKIGFGGNSAGSREQEFEEFLDGKIKLAQESGAVPKDRQISEEERKQAKEYFAKSRIYADEAMAKRGELGEAFWKKVELQTRLQQAQLLARLYMQNSLQKKLAVTDEEVNQYIAAHPEIDNSGQQRAKAEEILQKVKNGGDFAQLAKEFSEDPGSKDKGGLYEGVAQGAFVPEFENAALALEPGQVAPGLVESKFGYHIIKLEKKGETKDPDGQVKRTFDARHILIATGVKDPENPTAPAMPVKDYVKQKLQEEKQETVYAEIKASNPVEVATDFKVPEVSPEQMNQMMQQQMPSAPPPPPPPAENNKAEENKPGKDAANKK